MKSLSLLVRSGTILAVFIASPSRSETLIDCDSGIQGGDHLSFGFYVPSFPGQALDGVDVFLASSTAGAFDFSLTARDGTYDGPVLGVAQVTMSLNADVFESQRASFVFPAVAIGPGSTVTFVITKDAGPGGVQYYDVLTSDPCPIIETLGTDPPLSEFRRNGIRALFYGQAVTAVEPATWGRTKCVYR